jgi:carbon-monoxide dehydrogenase large subunit
MVIAADRYAARDAADAVLVDYDPQPAVSDAARPSRTARRASTTSTTRTSAARSRTRPTGSATRSRRRARRDVAELNQRLTPIADGDRGLRRRLGDANGEVTLYTSTQVPHFVRTFVAVINETSESKVRVVAPDVGGGFGRS